jgi:predicted alpha/beta superfamily hydrolase
MARTRSTIAGRVDVVTMMLRDRRVPVRIYVPAGYEHTDITYPVLYMFDGHNLFDRTTSTYDKEWRVDETMEWVARATEYTPAIVVGIDAPQSRYERYEMYSLGSWDFRHAPDSRRLKRIEAYGEQTAEFLFTEVKTYVETTYRCVQERSGIGVGGSSMGGFMSLYCAAAYPQLVSKVIALSPVVLDFPMAGWHLRDMIVQAGADLPQRFFLEMGTHERLDYATPQQLTEHLNEVVATLRTAGHADVYARLIPNGRHDERWWARQFTGAFLWAFHEVVPDPWH